MDSEEQIRAELKSLDVRQRVIHAERAQLNAEEEALMESKQELWESLGHLMIYGSRNE